MNTSFERHIWSGAILLIVAAGAFWAGMTYASSQKTLPQPNSLGASNGPAEKVVLTHGIGNAAGKIVSTSGSGIVIALAGGKTQTVAYTASTTVTVTKIDAESSSKLGTGDQVFVVGAMRPDGSIAAQTIQVTLNSLPATSPAVSAKLH